MIFIECSMAVMILNKICTECNRELPATSEFFHKDEKGKNGLRAECKDCKNKKNRKYERKDQEKRREYLANWKKEAMKNSPLNISYTTIHKYMREHNKPPNQCQLCNKTRKVELANISGIYTRDMKDYMWLCKQCHVGVDSNQIDLPSEFDFLINYMKIEDHENSQKQMIAEFLDPLYNLRDLVKLLTSYVDHHSNDYEGNQIYTDIKSTIQKEIEKWQKKRSEK